MNKNQLQTVIEWLLVVFVVVTALVAWWQGRFLTGGANLTVYDIFPVFGLLAFGMMWTHFISGASRRALGLKSRRSLYWKLSSGLVLALIVLHPGLLWYQLWADGFGLPPASYLTVYSAQALWVLLGTLSLCIFLSFELHRWYKDKSWWRYVEWAQLFAMGAIFFHALTLGHELTLPWFMAVWWSMGITLVASVVYTIYIDATKKEEAKK